MRALVSGGAGFLGSHLVERLVTAGHAVEVIDDLSGGSLANLAVARAEAARAGTELKIHTLDVRVAELAAVLARRPPDVVFHLAHVWSDDRASAELVFAGGLNVVDAAARAGVGKVVATLDAAALIGEVSPRDLPVRDGHPWAPVTLPGIAQRALADVLVAYRTDHALEFTALALTTIYGPRDAHGPVQGLIADALAGRPCVLPGDGRQTLDLLYVDDAVDALVRAATRGSGLVVNVGTGVQTSLRDLERMVAGPDAPPPVHADTTVTPSRFAVSPARARIHLAWASWTSLADGLTLTREALTAQTSS